MLPKIDEVYNDYGEAYHKVLFRSDEGTYYLRYYIPDVSVYTLTLREDGKMQLSLTNSYKLVDGEWIKHASVIYFTPIWSSIDLYAFGSESVALYASDPVVTLIDVPDPPVAYSDLQSIISAYTGQISLITIVNILVAGVGCSICLVFLWWGIRKTTGMLIKAFKKGKLRI